MSVEHAMIKARRGPEHFDLAGIDVAGCLFIHPNQIADSSGVRASFVQRFEHVDLARARIAMFAEIGVEGKQVYFV